MELFNTQDKTRSVAVEGGVPADCVSCLNGSVNVATGQFFHRCTDLFIPGTIGLRLDRVYGRNSVGVLGQDWAGTWAQHLKVDEKTITYQNPDGVQVIFYAPEDRVIAGNLRFPDLELIGSRKGALKIYNLRARLFYVFDEPERPRRRLTRIMDRNGNAIRFLYDGFGLSRVVHSDGFALDVQSAAGRIQRAQLIGSDAVDCGFEWTYNAQGQLTEMRSAQVGHVSYSYDKKGRVIGWRDRAERHVHFDYKSGWHYGADGRIVRMWSESGHGTATLSYDLKHQRTETRNSEDAVTLWDWTTQGLVWRKTDPLGHIWQTEWDRYFHITGQIDPLGHKTSYAYDRLGNLVSVTDADGRNTRWDYDELGQLQAMVDPAGKRTEYRRDDHGNVIWSADPLGRITIKRLGDNGQTLRIERPGGGHDRIYYDRLLRPNRQSDPDGVETRMSYDTEGRLVWVSDAFGAWVQYDHTRAADNPHGAVRQVETADGAITRAGYDAGGRLVSVCDPNEITHHARFGPFDIPIETVDPKGYPLRLEHDREGALRAMINACEERIEWALDAAGQVRTMRDYAGLITEYIRDAAGRVTLKIAPDGTRTHYIYSRAGRLLERRVDEPWGEVLTRFIYDPCGRLLRAENAHAVVEFERDDLGRVVVERLNGRAIKSEYSEHGERIARTGAVLPISQSWSPGGRLTELCIGTHAPLGFDYDVRGLEIRRHSAAGFVLDQSYTFRGRLAEQSAGVAGVHADPPPDLPRDPQPVAGRRMRVHRCYDWDLADRVLSVRDDHMGTQQVQYNAQNAISAVYTSGADEDRLRVCECDYDAAGHIATITTTDQDRQTIKTIAGRVTRRGDHISYVYDKCGRVIEKYIDHPELGPCIWRMTWTGQGHLSTLKAPDGRVWHYRYDPLGRRIARIDEETGTGTAYQWEGAQLIAEAPMAADGVVAWDAARHWVYAPGTMRVVAQVEGAVLRYIVSDHNDSPCEMLSEDGQDLHWRVGCSIWGTGRGTGTVRGIFTQDMSDFGDTITAPIMVSTDFGSGLVPAGPDRTALIEAYCLSGLLSE